MIRGGPRGSIRGGFPPRGARGGYRVRWPCHYVNVEEEEDMDTGGHRTEHQAATITHRMAEARTIHMSKLYSCIRKLNVV
ncbi:hypothetical protein ANCDUO_07761 [Ancylostoma duodenale]|uniref:Uncharacterized protein n=1 Tax=Ancylostoma duodenale TaxID=51022 RepID=A0A0C2DHM7_9BILA|nr:hypothetical protein ANCDUO_07761 [Ancylostoma duodenale]